MLSKSYQEAMSKLSTIMEYPWHDLNFYSCWLAQSYFYTSRSTRLLLMAASHATMEQSALHRRFAIHATEEKGHELLAVRDLKDLGWDIQTIGEFPMTTAFYATQFYKVQNQSSQLLMGWVLPLEGVAVEYGEKIRDAVKKHHPKASTRFLDIHIGEDEAHVAEAIKAIETIPKEEMPGIINNIETTADMYLRVLDQCKEKAALLSDKRKVG